MQKGKHQGGQTQGYPPRNYSAYPGNPENARQYSRVDVPAFHASGTPGGGPGMRGMHHAQPTQPPTPPTSQDIKQPPGHLPPQAHQMPPQSAGQMMQYGMPGTGRGNTQQTQYYNAPRAAPGSQRMAPHARPTVMMSNSAQSFISQPVVQSMYQGHMLSTQMSGQAPLFVSPPMSQPFQIQQPRHQSGTFYPTPQIQVPPQIMFAPYSQQPMYFASSIQMSRTGGPAPNSQGAAPAQPQPPMTLIAGHGGAMIPNPGVSQPVTASREKKILTIIDPDNGRNVLEDMKVNDNTSSRSGESSARQTPQPNAGQKTDQGVAADFATRVAIAARSDHSGSPNSPALQQSSSRTSNYSESESQASPDPQGMSTPSVSPSKLDTSVESISSESQIVENNIPFDTNQQTTMMRSGWTPMIPGGSVPLEILPMPIHPGMIIPEDMMRGAPLPNQPAREYQAVQSQWISDGNPVSVIISKEPPAQLESPVRPAPERVTPVVSALAQGPTVDIGPRAQREHFPALGKGHQQQSPVKRKQRSEQQTQEQTEGKVKDQQTKTVRQSLKPKSVTPTVVESKKQSTPPSQDSDEYVQSVQTKNTEQKTIIIKKNDSDSSETKTKSNDSLINKESNNVETRNLNQDMVQDNNNRNEGEKVKCEVAAVPQKESSPRPPSEESVGKIVLEEVRENASSSSPVPEPEVAFTPTDNGASVKANGETPEEDAKSNNQKSKSGNKRPAQSKMRLEPNNTRMAEPQMDVAVEVTPSAPPVPETKNSAPPAVVINDQTEKTQEETTTEEDKEIEKEDLMVASKNEENNKQTTSMKANDATTPAAPNKLVLKHNYESGQWSPLNPDGKKKYDREFIMGLQREPHSLRKPSNLPNLDLLSDNNKQRPFDRNVTNSMNRSHSDLINFFKNSSQRGQPITKRGSQQGNARPKAAKPAVMQVSLQQDVKLHETENAWKPTRKVEPVSRTEEEAKTESLYKRVRGILNKLTPEKFNKLVAQVQELPIDNSTRLQGVIDLVFRKAVDEPSFSVAYAQMCSTLQKMEVPSDKIRPDGKPEPENFRKLLVSRCQQEFEKNTAEELQRDERLKEIDQEKDPEKKKALQLQFEEEERRIRMRSVGNIRFIGELYKLQMLTCNIMHNCIKQLLNQGDEESLECLCKLLTTIGQGLESISKTPKSDNRKDDRKDDRDLSNYFKKLTDIVKNKGSGKVSSRVRFMIQDLIDLRNNKWVPRRNESQPKTIDQIQKEAERENMEMNYALNSPQERNKRQDSRNSVDNRKRGGPDSSGWTTVTGTQQNKSRHFLEFSKLKLDQSDVENAGNLSLGSRTQFMLWSQGASSGKMDDKKPVSQLGSNKFAVLSTTSSGNSSMKGNSISNKDEGRSSKSGSQQDPNSRSSSRESASSKREDNRFISPQNKVQLPPAPAPAPASEPNEKLMQEITKNSKFLLEEYLNCLDVNEASKDLSDRFSQANLKDFVTNICCEAMEKKGSEPKKAVGALMNHFIKNKEISLEQFLVGLSKVLETADDLAIDMPFVWEYLSEILVNMFAEEVIDFRDIVSAITPIQGSPGSAKLLAALVKLLNGMKGAEWLEQRWNMSQVSLTDIINEEDVNNFVKQNKVEFMLGKKSVGTLDNVKSELSKMITAKASSFDEITDWVTANVGAEKSKEPLFVRTLMTVLLEASVTKGQSSTYKLNLEFFSHYDQLILRYTNHQEELELPCLFAIQAFVHKLEYPQAILYNVFNHLCDAGLIASESFIAWRESTDPHEQEGHAVCVKSLTSFFTHLNETETDDES